MPDYIDPTKESFTRFRAVSRAGPIQMLNLIKLRTRAAYEDGRNATGAEAYKTYSRKAAPIFQGLGGRIVWSGRPEVMVIGPDEGEDWDIAFIAEYPSADAFTTMLRDPAYRAITFHRTAAVQNSRLIRMAPQEIDGSFA